MVGASGESSDNPPVAWYREVKEVDQQVEDTAQLFLGLRIQCARCHHHPFEAWSQRDYYGFAAFFAQVGRKPGEATDEERVFHQRGIAAATNPKTGESLKPTPRVAPAWAGAYPFLQSRKRPHPTPKLRGPLRFRLACRSPWL